MFNSLPADGTHYALDEVVGPEQLRVLFQPCLTRPFTAENREAALTAVTAYVPGGGANGYRKERSNYLTNVLLKQPINCSSRSAVESYALRPNCLTWRRAHEDSRKLAMAQLSKETRYLTSCATRQ